VGTTANRSQPLNRGLIEHPPSHLPQLTAHNEVLHLSRRDPKAFSRLGNNKQTHNRKLRLCESISQPGPRAAKSHDSPKHLDINPHSTCTRGLVVRTLPSSAMALL
jgi:hypothetical protein